MSSISLVNTPESSSRTSSTAMTSLTLSVSKSCTLNGNKMVLLLNAGLADFFYAEDIAVILGLSKDHLQSLLKPSAYTKKFFERPTSDESRSAIEHMHMSLSARISKISVYFPHAFRMPSIFYVFQNVQMITCMHSAVHITEMPDAMIERRRPSLVRESSEGIFTTEEFRTASVPQLRHMIGHEVINAGVPHNCGPHTQRGIYRELSAIVDASDVDPSKKGKDPAVTFRLEKDSAITNQHRVQAVSNHFAKMATQVGWELPPSIPNT